MGARGPCRRNPSVNKCAGRFNISVNPRLCRPRHVFESPARGAEHNHSGSSVRELRMGKQVRLAVVMDPIADIKYAKDTTLGMLLAAQARGWSLHYLEQADLRLRDGVAEGNARALDVRPDPADWYSLGEPAVEPLGGFDVIL